MLSVLPSAERLLVTYQASVFCDRFQRSGMLVGDVVVGVEDADTKWACHDDVVQLVRQAGCELRLTLVTMSRPAAPDSAAVRPFNTVKYVVPHT